MTTTLLIQTDKTPLMVELPAIAPMTREEFYAFCRANPDLRIERTAMMKKHPLLPFSPISSSNSGLLQIP